MMNNLQSSAVMAKSLKLNNIQVRKDLACVSSQSGKPRMGFEIESLINDIEEVLGFNSLDEVVLVGAGRLGRTLLSYQGFADYKLNSVAGFEQSYLFDDILQLPDISRPPVTQQCSACRVVK